MASYSYDETGQYYVRATSTKRVLDDPVDADGRRRCCSTQFFLITFLTFLLVPWTYFAAFANGGWSQRHVIFVKTKLMWWSL